MEILPETLQWLSSAPLRQSGSPLHLNECAMHCVPSSEHWNTLSPSHADSPPDVTAGT